MQKKAANFANHMSDSVGETLAQRRKIACTLFRASPEDGCGNLKGTGYKDHAIRAGMIRIVKLGPGNKEQISVNTVL